MYTLEDRGNRRGTSKPRSIVRLDGVEVWFQSWSINLNSAHQADDFTIELPFRITRDQGQAGYLYNTPELPSHLLTKSSIGVEIFVGYPADPDRYTASDLTRLMFGSIDTIEISGSESGEKVSLSGRNKLAALLDNKTSEKFPNTTASGIADTLAKRRGLKPAITPTHTLAGRYFNDESSEMSSEQSEWDLLTFLSEKEGYELRVRDDTLWFGPFDQVVGAVTTAQPLAYTWGQNVESFTLSRSPHAAKNLEVEVHSYHAGSSKHLTATAKRTISSSSDTHQERFFFPGLTQQQAQKKAESLLSQLARLELTGSLSVSGDPCLQVDRMIGLYGVGQTLSQLYYIRQAGHQFDYSGGYRTNLTVSNVLMADLK